VAGLAEVARFTDIPWSGNNDANDPLQTLIYYLAAF
jgi:hypothetical protein